jgi:hypothetical protein
MFIAKVTETKSLILTLAKTVKRFYALCLIVFIVSDIIIEV